MDKIIVFRESKTRPYRVGFLLIDGFSLLSYSAASEPLRAANRLAGETFYQIWNIPAQGARSLASCGALLPADTHVGERLGFDLVIVIAASDSVDAQQPRLLDWLRQLARRNIMLGGIEAGSLMLIRAGLARSRKIALHWSFREAVRETHPEVSLVPGVFVIDGDRISCSGGTAPVDLMHALISTQHGVAFAQKVSDWLSHTHVRRSEEPQRAEPAVRFGTSNREVLTAIALMESHLSDPLDLVQLAASVSKSERQINRLFRQELGTSTMDFYKILRLKKSQQLLGQTSLSISEIVAATGFVSASHFSRSYKRHFSKTPSEARASHRNFVV